MAYSYWQRPGVIRLTKVYVFNMTNQDAFLNNGEKPRLQEIGPFVYRWVWPACTCAASRQQSGGVSLVMVQSARGATGGRRWPRPPIR